MFDEYLLVYHNLNKPPIQIEDMLGILITIENSHKITESMYSQIQYEYIKNHLTCETSTRL